MSRHIDFQSLEVRDIKDKLIEHFDEDNEIFNLINSRLEKEEKLEDILYDIFKKYNIFSIIYHSYFSKNETVDLDAYYFSNMKDDKTFKELTKAEFYEMLINVLKIGE